MFHNVMTAFYRKKSSATRCPASGTRPSTTHKEWVYGSIIRNTLVILPLILAILYGFHL
uniref:Uncharacterized protein n=1 Tax=Hyaloperonospora arabidopsidis (strain Emoy2) TaxID=559515 RepID=M4C6W6_HYAAE